ncbi:hypothetical protein FRUB_03106 [Fimbriiglobus ruber]|uniref:Uncharacterized protein n=1 Tax=Fimbriiglobus ruber TaxID=1908690 RepID=A0A225E515_9BACT|nr:hypothetical protein FRUB_03106 [Fimbriiglobus ruber]
MHVGTIPEGEAAEHFRGSLSDQLGESQYSLQRGRPPGVDECTELVSRARSPACRPSVPFRTGDQWPFTRHRQHRVNERVRPAGHERLQGKSETRRREGKYEVTATSAGGQREGALNAAGDSPGMDVLLATRTARSADLRLIPVRIGTQPRGNDVVGRVFALFAPNIVFSD